MKVYLDIASIIVDGHPFHDQPHQWCNGWSDHIKCGRSLVSSRFKHKTIKLRVDAPPLRTQH